MSYWKIKLEINPLTRLLRKFFLVQIIIAIYIVVSMLFFMAHDDVSAVFCKLFWQTWIHATAGTLLATVLVIGTADYLIMAQYCYRIGRVDKESGFWSNFLTVYWGGIGWLALREFTKRHDLAFVAIKQTKNDLLEWAKEYPAVETEVKDLLNLERLDDASRLLNCQQTLARKERFKQHRARSREEENAWRELEQKQREENAAAEAARRIEESKAIPLVAPVIPMPELLLEALKQRASKIKDHPTRETALQKITGLYQLTPDTRPWRIALHDINKLLPPSA